MATQIHSSACVDEGARVGDGTRIWHFSHVAAGATIGRNCSLGQGVFVADGAKVGDHVKVQNNVSLYTGVQLEDFVFCGPSCVFTNVINPRSEIPRRDEYRQTLIRRGATIGANATIVCGTTVGRYALIGAGSVVTRDVPQYALVLGVPAQRVGWVSRHGHRLEAEEDGSGWLCPQSSWRYELRGPDQLVCVDWSEDAPLSGEGGVTPPVDEDSD